MSKLNLKQFEIISPRGIKGDVRLFVTRVPSGGMITFQTLCLVQDRVLIRRTVFFYRTWKDMRGSLIV